MNVLLDRNRVSSEMVEQVAQKLADFHAKAATSPTISAFGKIEAIRVNTEENFTQTEKYIGSTITAKQYQRIKDYTDGILREKAEVFNRRVAEGGSGTATEICMPSTSALPMEFVFMIASSLMTGSAIVMWLRRSLFWPWIWTITAGPTFREALPTPILK